MNTEEAESYWKEGTEEMEYITRINEEEEQEEGRNKTQRGRSTSPILHLPLQSSREESPLVRSEREE
jgi:hypothetical protein